HRGDESRLALARGRRCRHSPEDPLPVGDGRRARAAGRFVHSARRAKVPLHRRRQSRPRCVGNGTRAAPSARTPQALVDYKSLLTKVERTLEQIESAESMRFTVEQIAETIAANFRDELGITGGRIYERNDDQNYYELVSRFGKVQDGALGIAVP